MYIDSIGDVREVNCKYIFIINSEGKQDRIPAAQNKLQEIYEKATNNVRFYERMVKEIREEYEKMKVDYEKKYHYITDDDIKAANKEKAWNLSLMQESNNMECKYRLGFLFGFFEASSFASDKEWEAYKIMKQAENACKNYKKTVKKTMRGK